jgi:hypothetical protein
MKNRFLLLFAFALVSCLSYGQTPPVGINTNVVRSLNSTFTPHVTRAARVFYTIQFSGTVNITTTTAQSATAYLEFQYPWEIGTSTWNEVARVGMSTTVGLAIALSLTQTDIKELTGIIPGGALAQIRVVSAGGMTTTFIKGTEEIY